MLFLRCPRCKTPYRLPDERSGSRIRCTKCDRVFLATGGSAAAPKKDWSGPLAAGLFVLVAGTLLLAFGGSLGLWGGVPEGPIETAEREGVPAKPPPREPFADPAVAAARNFVASVDTYNREMLSRLLDLGRHHAAEGARLGDERPPYDRLSEAERSAWREQALDGLFSEGRRGELSGRDAVDGDVEERRGSEALVRLDLRPRSGGESEAYDFRLSFDGTAWKVFDFERRRAREEAAAAVAERKPKRVTLADGTTVREGLVESMDHLPDTPPELRSRIDALLATLTDLQQTRGAMAAQRDLVAIGKPAIPRLLDAFAKIPFEGEENAIRLNLLDNTLEEITGRHSGYAPILGEGATNAVNEEIRRSAIKQWFAWWYYNQKSFQGPKEQPDMLEIELTGGRATAPPGKGDAERPPR